MENLFKIAVLFLKDYFFQTIILYVFLLSPLGRYDPYLKEFLPSYFHHHLMNNDFPQLLLRLTEEFIFTGLLISPIISLNIYLMHINTFRKNKEYYFASKVVLILLASTVLSFPFRNILGPFNLPLSMFLTSLLYIFLGYFRMKKNNPN